MDETKNTDGERILGKDEQHAIIRIKKDVLKWIIFGLLAIMILVLVFGLGMFVGATKANFSYRWAENYHRNFGGPKEGFMNDFRMPPPNNEFIDAHGTFGEIIKIEGSELVIKSKDNVEKVIVINKNTIITAGRKTITQVDLKIGEQVVIIGSPNEQGQIEAKLIRVFKFNAIRGQMINI